MAWQSTVVEMERSFVDANRTIAVARRRNASASPAMSSAKLQKDFDDMLAESDATRKENDAETRASTTEDTSSVNARVGGRNGTVGAVVTDASGRERDADDGAGDVVPGMEDFGPAVTQEERVMTKLEPKSDGRQKSTLIRALEATQRLGLVGAAVLFGVFLIFFAFAMFEEMQQGARERELRPDFGPNGPFVDKRTVAEEAAMRGESATAALLDVERESGVLPRRMLRR